MMPFLTPEAAIVHPWTVKPVAGLYDTATSRVASGAGAMDPSLSNYWPLFFTSSERPEVVEAPKEVWRWAALGGSGASYHIVAGTSGNTIESKIDYFVFDDDPTPLAGSLDMVARYGPVGYWRKSMASDPLFAAASLDVSEIVSALADMQDGWMGEDSVAPSSAVCADVGTVLASLWQVSREPEIEVDEDGSVALLWDNAGRSFGLTFLGNGKVVGSLSPRVAEYAPWTLDVTEYQALHEKVSLPHVAPLLA